MSPLKCCPFCGAWSARLHYEGGSDERTGYNYIAFVSCPCGARVSAKSSEDKRGWCKESLEDLLLRVKDKWNRRAP